ncbi:segregation and condensation protein B [Aureibacter tunicatorum]|uniref:Segregation and condensation protein B n=1 Tax=Aureibacter tunicatorum TaxID=866807 RepID=A0AAE3XPF8_9BACT|nr:segregation and condensation protein B [Aureibacter tunicatorum]
MEEASGVMIEKSMIQGGIDFLVEKYNDDDYAFSIYEINEGYIFKTKPAYKHFINTLTKVQSKKKLSASALETLSIIAYKQPVTKGEVEKIRGVNSDYAVKRLLEKGLIEIRGKSDLLGRPLLYGTSDFFMEYFGLASINDLPSHLENEKLDNKIGLEQEL